MFGMNFGNKTENKIPKVTALEREPSKEELIEAKLEKLNISKQELEVSIQNAGGMEKVSQYLSENGNIDLWKHTTSKTAEVLRFGAIPAGLTTIIAMFASNNDGITVAAAATVTGVIGSIYGFIKAKQEKRKQQTVDVLMDIAETKRMDEPEIYEQYMTRLAKEAEEKKALEEKSIASREKKYFE